MNRFQGQAISWEVANGVIELALHREPCNEIGSLSLEELEKFAAALDGMSRHAHALIVHSTMQSRILCRRRSARTLSPFARDAESAGGRKGVRDFLERIHRVLNAIDAAPLTTIAARPRCDFRRRLRTGSGLRPDHRRQNGALLLSRAAPGIDSRVWRHSATEARSRQCAWCAICC